MSTSHEELSRRLANVESHYTYPGTINPIGPIYVPSDSIVIVGTPGSYYNMPPIVVGPMNLTVAGNITGVDLLVHGEIPNDEHEFSHGLLGADEEKKTGIKRKWQG